MFCSPYYTKLRGQGQVATAHHTLQENSHMFVLILSPHGRSYRPCCSKPWANPGNEATWFLKKRAWSLGLRVGRLKQPEGTGRWLSRSGPAQVLPAHRSRARDPWGTWVALGTLHRTSTQQLRQAARKPHHTTTTDKVAEPSPLPVTTQDAG